MVPNQARLNAARISGRGCRAQNLFARALLHFVRGAIGEREDNETRQRAHRIGRLRELRDAIGHGARLAGTGCGDDGEIAVERLRKTIAGCLIAVAPSSTSSPLQREIRMGEFPAFVDDFGIDRRAWRAGNLS